MWGDVQPCFLISPTHCTLAGKLCYTVSDAILMNEASTRIARQHQLRLCFEDTVFISPILPTLPLSSSIEESYARTQENPGQLRRTGGQDRRPVVQAVNLFQTFADHIRKSGVPHLWCPTGQMQQRIVECIHPTTGSFHSNRS